MDKIFTENSIPVLSNYTEIYEKNEKTVVYCTNNKSSYILGAKEAIALKHIDGKKNIKEIYNITKSGSLEEIVDLFQLFYDKGFLLSSCNKPRINPLDIKIPIIKMSFQQNEETKINLILYKILIFASIPIFIIGICLFLQKCDLSEILTNIKNVQSVYKLICCIISWLFISFCHEYSHSIFAKHHGAIIREYGIGLYYFFPCAYIGFCGLSLVSSASKRIEIHIGGILSNIILAGLALIYLSCSSVIETFFAFFILINIISVVINSFLFLKMDGYFILEELSGIQHLRERALKFLFHCNNEVYDYATKYFLFLYSLICLIYLFVLSLSTYLVIKSSIC